MRWSLCHRGRWRQSCAPFETLHREDSRVGSFDGDEHHELDEIRLRVLIGGGSGQICPLRQTSSWDTDLNYPVVDDDDRLTQILEAAHHARRDIMLAAQVGAWLVNAEYDA